MSPPADDEVSTGELSRNIRDMRADFSTWRNELTSTLAGFVTLQLYQSEMTTMRAETARIEAESKAEISALRTEYETDRDRWERWKLAIFTALVALVIVALIVGAVVIQKVS